MVLANATPCVLPDGKRFFYHAGLPNPVLPKKRENVQ